MAAFLPVSNTSQAWFVWALSASISLSSSKILLVDLGLHYPFYLQFLQLSVAAGLFILRIAVSCFSSTQVRFSVKNRLDFLLLLLLSGSLAISSTLITQAVLHFPNLATLSMLPVS